MPSSSFRRVGYNPMEQIHGRDPYVHERETNPDGSGVLAHEQTLDEMGVHGGSDGDLLRQIA